MGVSFCSLKNYLDDRVFNKYHQILFNVGITYLIYIIVRIKRA